MSNPVTLATTRWGSGTRRALLLHGVTSSSAGWWRLAPDLVARGYTVTAPDLRGHGSSPRGDVMTLEGYCDDVLALGDSWDLVLGHSLGGALVVQIVSGRSQWADLVILEDPALVIDDAGAAMDSFTEPWNDPIDAATIAAANPRWLDRDVEVKVNALRDCGRETVVRTVEDSAPWDLRPLLGGLTMPTLLLGADPALGALVSPEFGTAIASSHPSITFEVVAGGSHSIHRDGYDAFWAGVDRFLAAQVT